MKIEISQQSAKFLKELLEFELRAETVSNFAKTTIVNIISEIDKNEE